jgi:hypothetical protein
LNIIVNCVILKDNLVAFTGTGSILVDLKSDGVRGKHAVATLTTFLRTNRLPVHEKVQVKFTLEQATMAQRGSRGIALLFL